MLARSPPKSPKPTPKVSLRNTESCKIDCLSPTSTESSRDFHRQGSQRGAHGYGGPIGRGALGNQHEEATVLGDQLEPRSALGCAPTHPPVAILERVAGGSPRRQGDGPGVDLDVLPLDVARRGRRAQIVAFLELGIEPSALPRRARHAHDGGGIGACGRMFRNRPPTSVKPESGLLCTEIAIRQPSRHIPPQTEGPRPCLGAANKSADCLCFLDGHGRLGK